MFPGLRIGACLLPNSLRNSFIKYRRVLEVDSSMFSQAALNIYIKTGMFDNHIKETLHIQNERNQAFTTYALKTPELFQLDLFQTSKSFITLPENVSVTLFEKQLKENRVILEDIGRNVPTSYKCENKMYTIELLQLSPNEISTGVKLIQNAYLNSKRS